VIRVVIVAAALVCSSSLALAASGSPEERAACRPDVRKFCHDVRMAAGDAAFVECLKANRDKLTKECRAALESNGQ
jgi:hypothetical protein